MFGKTGILSNRSFPSRQHHSRNAERISKEPGGTQWTNYYLNRDTLEQDIRAKRIFQMWGHPVSGQR